MRAISEDVRRLIRHLHLHVGPVKRFQEPTIVLIFRSSNPKILILSQANKPSLTAVYDMIQAVVDTVVAGDDIDVHHHVWQMR